MMVYINEAHAVDVWNIGMSAGTVNTSHKTIEDRIGCAKKFQHEFNVTMPLFVDNMSDDFETLYASWPVRLFAIKSGHMAYISTPHDSEVDIIELFDFMNGEDK